MSVRTAPCDWPLSYSACGPCDALTSASDEDRAVYETMATDFLWAWTGRAFGVCPITVRPCGPSCWEGVSTWNGSIPYPQPTIVNGVWYNIGCNRCGDPCQCGNEYSIALPGPIDSVTEVTIDGVVVDPATYRVENHRWLVRAAEQWPDCGLEVSYQRGIPVPIGGQMAAGLLACEFAKSLCNDATCALPQRIQNITRQGVTVTLMDDFKTLQDGATGIWLIDSWVQSVTRSRTHSSVRSVDVQKPRVTTGSNSTFGTGTGFAGGA